MGGRPELLVCEEIVHSTQRRADVHAACLSHSTKNRVLLSLLVRGINVARENLCSYLLLISLEPNGDSAEEIRHVCSGE
jgi:hypothetical protein